MHARLVRRRGLHVEPRAEVIKQLLVDAPNSAFTGDWTVGLRGGVSVHNLIGFLPQPQQALAVPPPIATSATASNPTVNSFCSFERIIVVLLSFR